MEVDDSLVPPPHATPPKPPDIPTKVSFKERLFASENVIDMEVGECSKSPKAADINTPSLNEISTNFTTITLSHEENRGLQAPWKFSLIIKLVEKRNAHQYLKSKLQQL